MTKNKLYWVFIILVFVSCRNKSSNNAKPIVKVFDNYLYADDIVLPNNYSAEDSINIVQAYVNRWIQDQLMLNQAENNLDEQKIEIDRKTQDFRNTLLIHKYKEIVVEKNLDSNITASEIEEYYNNHKDEFKLNTTIVKGYFFRIPNEKTDMEELNTIKGQDAVADLNKVFNFVTKVGGNYDDFSQNWQIFSEKMLKMPQNNNRNGLRKNMTLEAKDEQYYYCMFVSDFIKSGKKAPLEYVNDRIASIIIQKKSTQILEQNRQKIYNEAMSKGDIEYYLKN